MFINSDWNEKYTKNQLYFRQRYTVAHEIGHVMLHSDYDDWNKLEPGVRDRLEVEANWFASRLLMPDYAFQSITDMLPEILSSKCQVNLLAAKKRISRLNGNLMANLIRDHCYLECSLIS